MLDVNERRCDCGDDEVYQYHYDCLYEPWQRSTVVAQLTTGVSDVSCVIPARLRPVGKSAISKLDCLRRGTLIDMAYISRTFPVISHEMDVKPNNFASYWNYHWNISFLDVPPGFTFIDMDGETGSGLRRGQGWLSVGSRESRIVSMSWRISIGVPCSDEQSSRRPPSQPPDDIVDR